MSSKPIKYRLGCDSCGSSDAVTLYSDGHSFCYSCQNYISDYNNKKKNNNELSEFSFPLKEAVENTSTWKVSPTPIDSSRFVELTDRGISQRTASFYNVWVNDKGEQVYPYFSRDGKTLLANKYRTSGQKGFLVQGEINKSGLFGQQLFPSGSAKQITITEGEADSLAAYQMTGSKYPVVSVKSASSARKDVADNYEYLDSFETIVICFDKDEEHKRPDGTSYFPGQDAAEKVAAMFKPGKVRVLTLKDAKDANDYLKNGWSDKFQKEWWAAPVWSPIGIKHAVDLWEEVKKTRNHQSLPYPWEGLNQLAYGLRTSELVTITAHTGVGKTSVLKEITHNILRQILENKDDPRSVGLMMLEEPNQDTLLGLMSITANKPLHLPDVFSNTSEEELRKYFDATYKEDKVILWDHFGANDISKVLSFVRYMANLGCKYIILDHLSIIVSDQSGDERKQLDEITTKLKTLTMELDICVICVVHQNRKGEIRGTAGIEQLSNIVIKLHRDPKSEDEEVRNTTKVVVEKNRFCGRTGPACLLKYDAESGRITELPQSDWEKFENKASKKEEEDEYEW